MEICAPWWLIPAEFVDATHPVAGTTLGLFHELSVSQQTPRSFLQRPWKHVASVEIMDINGQ